MYSLHLFDCVKNTQCNPSIWRVRSCRIRLLNDNPQDNKQKIFISGIQYSLNNCNSDVPCMSSEFSICCLQVKGSAFLYMLFHFRSRNIRSVKFKYSIYFLIQYTNISSSSKARRSAVYQKLPLRDLFLLNNTPTIISFPSQQLT